MKNPGGGIKLKYSATLDDLVRVVGLPAMLYLARAYGGRTLRVLNRVTPSDPLCAAIGIKAASQLCAQYRGEHLSIPAESTVMLQYQRQLTATAQDLLARLSVTQGDFVTLNAGEAAFAREIIGRRIPVTADVPFAREFLELRRSEFMEYRNQLIRLEVASGEPIMRVAHRHKLDRRMIRKIVNAQKRSLPMLCVWQLWLPGLDPETVPLPRRTRAR